MLNDYKSGLSRKERHLIQMGYEDDINGLKNENEFYVYQNKIRNKVNGILQDTLLILKHRETVFDLNDELLINNTSLLIEIRQQIDSLIKINKP